MRAEETHSVENGVLQRVSVSQIETFDIETYGGCPRKWWLEKVKRFTRPTTKNQALGSRTHKEVENYLDAGVDTLGPIARAGKHFMPTPRVSLLLEHPIRFDVAGVPLTGYIDVVNQAEEYHDNEGVLRHEPGVVEVIDWKTSSDIGYAKSSDDLRRSVQMLGYAEWVRGHAKLDLSQPLERVRLSHGVFVTRGRPFARKTTTSIELPEIAEKWKRVIGVVEQMKVVAGAPTIDDVTPHLPSCDAYRSCHFSAICPRSAVQKLSFLGGKGEGMSLLNRFVKPATEVPAAPPEVQAEIAKLVAEEQAAKSASVPVEPVRIPGVYYHLPNGGKVQAWTLADGSTGPNSGDAYLDVACAGIEPKPYNAVPPELQRAVGVVPADAPKSLPPLSAQSIPPETLMGMSKEIQEAAKPFAESERPADEKPKRGRPKKVDPKPGIPTQAEKAAACDPPLTATSVGVVCQNPEDACDPTRKITPSPTVPGHTSLYVDVLVDGFATVSLEPYIVEKCRALENEYKAADLRCAPADGPLAFGKWKGALAAIIRAEPPPPGLYSLTDVRESEIRQVAAETLRPFCAVYVRGR